VDCALSQVQAERRLDARFRGDVLAGARATVRPGCTVTLVDLSQGGALVEAARPLRPGGRVHLQLHRGARQFLVAAHIVRCAVFALGGDEGVVYRGAMRFEERCEELWEEAPAANNEMRPRKLNERDSEAASRRL
jgi:PilZ domain